MTDPTLASYIDGVCSSADDLEATVYGGLPAGNLVDADTRDMDRSPWPYQLWYFLWLGAQLLRSPKATTR